MSIASQVFDAPRCDLLAYRTDLSDKEVVLCPICLREVAKGDFLRDGLEHILPRNVIAKDSAEKKRLGTLNQRCGVTLLCRQERKCRSDGRPARQGCNGLKGQLYDRLFRNLLDDSPHVPAELTHRHGVGILLMAYLGVFQYFGYDYILRPELDEVREQFDYPDQRRTNWLDNAKYNCSGSSGQVVATALGTPFVVGGSLTNDAPLHVLFRRFSAYLPKGHWRCRGLPDIPLLRPDVPEINDGSSEKSADGYAPSADCTQVATTRPGNTMQRAASEVHPFGHQQHTLANVCSKINRW